MSREGMKLVMDRWMTDRAFRAQLRQDAEGAVRRLGLQLDEDERAALRSVDWNLSDEELETRATKANPA